jgi:hypothetical protein
MARHTPDSRWSAAARLEYYDDRNGVVVSTGTENNFRIFAGSVNVDFAPSPALLWRMEIRQFLSKDPIYPGASGLQKTETCFVISAAATL